MQIIDLTKTIQFNEDDPSHMQVEVEHKPHSQALDLVRSFGLSDNLFPKKYKGWADDSIRMGVHSTTHLDAPWHYSPMCEGKPAKTIEYCIESRHDCIDTNRQRPINGLAGIFPKRYRDECSSNRMAD